MHLPTAAQRPRAWVIVSICALALIAGFLVLHDREEPEPRGLITLEAGATKNPQHHATSPATGSTNA